VLTCERNTLRFESASKEKQLSPAVGRGRKGSMDSLPDLEEDQPGRDIKSADIQTAQSACQSFAHDSDLMLRRFSRCLFVSSIARRTFYGYLVVLHVWIWIVLHHAAAVHSRGG